MNGVLRDVYGRKKGEVNNASQGGSKHVRIDDYESSCWAYKTVGESVSGTIKRVNMRCEGGEGRGRVGEEENENRLSGARLGSLPLLPRPPLQRAHTTRVLPAVPPNPPSPSPAALHTQLDRRARAHHLPPALSTRIRCPRPLLHPRQTPGTPTTSKVAACLPPVDPPFDEPRRSRTPRVYGDANL